MPGTPRISRAVLAASIVLLCCFSGSAETILNFPRLSFEEGSLTGIAIVNPTDSDATVVITAYGEDGQPLTGIQNGVEMHIGARQQVARLTSDLFAGNPAEAETVAWFQATSSVEGLTGFFLFQNTRFTVLDGADLPVADRQIVFTHVRVGALESTELNIINPGATTADLQIQLMRPDSLPISKSLSLKKRGVVRLDAAAFFGVSETAPGTYVKVSASADVAGFEIVRAEDTDPFGLNARSAAERLTHLYFPQFAVLDLFETALGVVNNSTQAVILTITAFRPDGSIYDTQDLKNNPVTKSLDPGEALVEDVEEMFGFSGDQWLEGWIQVEATSEAVTGFVTYGVPTTGSTATVAPSLGRTRAIFSHIATIQDFYTGLAVLNTGQLAANVRIVALEPSGETLGSFTTVLPPGHRISELIHELIPEAAGRNGGLIWVGSDLPVHMTSLFGAAKVLANIPPQASPATYVPDAGLPKMRVLPPLSVVQPNSAQIFSVEGPTDPVSWDIHGAEEAGATIGTIDQAGVYVAPPEAPTPKVVTVLADAGTQVAGASVDILEKSAILTSERVIQSVAYLGTLQRIYTAELTILSGGGSPFALQSFRPAEDGFDTEIFAVAGPNSKDSVIFFPGEKISKMIPYRATTGKEFLLLAAQTSGKVIRFDPDKLDTFDLAVGLNEPTSLVVDATTGNLLIAEKDRVSEIPRQQIETGLLSPAVAGEQFFAQAAIANFLDQGGDGIAIDRCTGNVYISDSTTGEVRQFLAEEERVRPFFEGLAAPGPLLGFYRDGVGCPESFHMLVIEQGTGTISLLSPTRGSINRWTSGLGSTDLEWISGAQQFAKDAAVLVPELNEGQQGGQYSLTKVELPGLYDIRPSNADEKAFVPVLPVPEPVSPTDGELIDQNVSTGACDPDPVRGFGFRVFFDWTDSFSAAGIAGYELMAQHSGASKPLFSAFVENSEFRVTRCNTVITDEKLTGWRWRVRAKDTLGNFSEWSESASFEFEPCMLAPGQACLDSSDLSLTKRASANIVSAGDLLEYRLEVKNGGPSRATGVTVTDRLSSRLIFSSAQASKGSCSESEGTVTCDLGSLNDGEEATAIIAVQVRLSAAGTLLTNSARVDAAQSDPKPSNNEASELVSVRVGTAAQSDLVLTKTGSPDEVDPGDRLTYTLKVVNRGPAEATGITLIDQLPVGTSLVSVDSSQGTCETSLLGIVTCSLGTLTVDETATVKIDVNINLAGIILVNSAFVTAAEDDPEPLNNTAVEETTVNDLIAAVSDLLLAHFDSVDPVALAGTLSYTLEVLNAGPDPATLVTLVDELPEEVTLTLVTATQGVCASLEQVVTCELGVLQPGALVKVDLKVNVRSEAGTRILNFARVDAAEEDQDRSNNYHEEETTVEETGIEPVADLSLEKSDSVDPVEAGASLTYTLTVTNAGPSAASDVVLTDTLPAGVTFESVDPSQGNCPTAGSKVTCNLGTIGENASAAVTITVSVNSESAGTTIVNSASVDAAEDDPNGQNNVADEDTAVAVPPEPEKADISVTIVDSGDPVMPGAPLTYTLTVKNTGPATATDLRLKNDLPQEVELVGVRPTGVEWSGTQSLDFSLGSMTSGTSTTIYIDVTVSWSAGGQTIRNSASVDSNESDPDSSNDSADETTYVEAVADLSLVKDADPDTILLDPTVTYTLTATNNGPNTATDVTVIDHLPKEAEYQSSTDGICQPSADYKTVTCHLGSLDSGKTAQVEIEVKMKGLLNSATNTASVSAAEADPFPGNNSATATTFKLLNTPSPDFRWF